MVARAKSGPSFEAFILAGGVSSRMRRAKHLLDFGGVPLILQTTRLVAPLVRKITIIGARRNTVPPYTAENTESVATADRSPAVSTAAHPLSSMNEQPSSRASDLMSASPGVSNRTAAACGANPQSMTVASAPAGTSKKKKSPS